MQTVASNYALFETGGKQYQAVVGKTLAVEKLNGLAGDSVTFDKVFFVKDGETCKVGAPVVPGATITAKIVKQTQGPKLIVFKFQRRKKYRVKNGHRQPLTVIRFESI